MKSDHFAHDDEFLPLRCSHDIADPSWASRVPDGYELRVCKRCGCWGVLPVRDGEVPLALVVMCVLILATCVVAVLLRS